MSQTHEYVVDFELFVLVELEDMSVMLIKAKNTQNTLIKDTINPQIELTN